jgi:eukaryotic-like serine/threonine-protein kinase
VAVIAERKTIGRFRVVKPLGRGGMGTVFKAFDPEINRLVAIKLLHGSFLDGGDASGVALLRREARASARCQHINIVGIYDIGTHEGAPYLVLEYVDGDDLAKVLARLSRMDAPTVARIGLQVLAALDCAHRLGIVHRDVKPENIIISHGGTAKVTDFAIAHAFGSEHDTNSVLLGAPYYMSPEQCLGDPVDPRSDLFSLGSVLYELLAGRQAFPGSSFVEIATHLLHQPAAPLHSLRPDVPPALAAVIGTALAKSPTDRFETAAAMAEALRAAADLAPADDQTVMVPRLRTLQQAGRQNVGGEGGEAGSERGAARSLFMLEPNLLSLAERQLAHHTGPLARLHVRDALKVARTSQEFVERLTAFVPEGDERASLRRALTALLRLHVQPDEPLPETAVRAIGRALSHMQTKPT